MIALAAAVFLIATSPEPYVRSAQASATIDVTLKDGKTAKPQTFRARRGDNVTLRVASDRKIALHLHGYDIERTAEPGKPAVFNFTATATGRFPMEEHVADAAKKSHKHAPAILYLEILPK
jgi:hypothetical protein